MKIHIAFPATGQNKKYEIEDEVKLRALYDKRVSDEVEGDLLGDEFKGYIFRIAGGQDKEGFAMKQGVLTNGRVKLLLARGAVGFQKWRGKNGEKKRKSVRGCIVGPDLAVVHLTVVKKGDGELAGLTDETRPRTLGPKRASKIRKLFNLTKEDDVRKYVIKHKKKVGKNGPEYMAGPKIQRLVTPERIARKQQYLAERKAKTEQRKKDIEAYKALLVQRKAELAKQKTA